MDKLHNRWAIPIVSGLLIISSWAASGTLADALMVAAAVVAGTGITIKAMRGLRARLIGIDLLVSIAAIGALFLGEFWEAAAVTFLFAIGGALEDLALNRTRSALTELLAVAPDFAVVLREGTQVEVPATEVCLGEIVLIKNGAKVPVDGVVIGGSGSIDEASITGESLPVEKAPGDRVFAGTITQGGFLQIEATGVGADTTLARIIHRVEQAQDAKGRTQTFMERFSRWYTPGIIGLALIVGLITKDVTLALTLLVIGCPGALVISIPVAIVAGIGRGARDGVLIKGGEYLETSARITAVALDKTGTLTQGKPVLTDVIPLDPTFDGTELLALAARAETGSEHPLARPIVQAAINEGVLGNLLSMTEPVPGQGIIATVESQRVIIGSPRLLHDQGVPTADAEPISQQLADGGRTPMLVAVDDRLVGVLGVADRIRDDAAEMVRQLHATGVNTGVMLTGDNRRVAQAVAAEVGVDEVYAGLLPEDKLEIVTQLKRDGHVVAMVGDGVNDAPALATADIGVAMGAGTGVAIETADIALLSDDLLKLPEALRLARRTVRTMRQNIVIALVTVGVLLAGVLFGGVTMAIGMFVHEASVLLVIGNAIRLLRKRPPRTVHHSTPLATSIGQLEGVTS